MVCLLLLLVLSTVWDFRTGRIPNRLILAGWIIGMVRCLYREGAGSLLTHLPGVIFPVLVLFLFFSIGTLGAGDIKLFSLSGWFFPFSGVLHILVFSFFFGAIFSLFILLRQGNLKDRFIRLYLFLGSCLLTGGLRFYYPDSRDKSCTGSGKPRAGRDSEACSLHFSLPILLGTLLTLGGTFG